jgi:hypothetical protein
MKSGEFDFKLLEKEFKKMFEELYPNSRDATIFVKNVSNEQTLSNQYVDEGELVADYIDRMTLDIVVRIDHKFEHQI